MGSTAHLALKFGVLLFTLLATPAVADPQILKGLPKGGSFNVVIEPLDPEAKKTGLNAASLAKVIQARVAKKGLKYNPGSEYQLFARIVVLPSYSVTNEVLGYGAHTELSFREKANLKRDKAFEFYAPTWFKGNVTVSNPKAFVGDVVNALAALTDQFVTDYVSVNK